MAILNLRLANVIIFNLITFLSASLYGRCFAQSQPLLQITSPADGTVVNPGQTITVTIAPAAGTSFVMVGVVAENPIGSGQFLAAPPYQLSVTIPKNISARKYRLHAVGAISQGHGVDSPSISLDVEPGASISSLRVDPPSVIAEFVGEQLPLAVWGTFSDGSTMDITNSSGTSYTSQDTMAVTVTNSGLVTAIGVGKYGNTPILVEYGGKQLGVLVSTRHLAAALPQSGPLLQITSPADGTVVNPGQTITVVVTPTSGVTFSEVGLLAHDPLIVAQTSTSPPYQFTVTIPQQISVAGSYIMDALGTISPGQGGESDPIDLDVEPAVPISKIRVQLSSLIFQHPGDSMPLIVFGDFSDGSSWDITHSSGTTYSSADPTAPTVDGNGIVTAVGVGKYGNTPILVQYGGQQFGVLASTRRLATPPHPVQASPR